MLTLTSALESAVSAMQADTQAMGVTSMNLDSQNVAGYARQVVQMTADGFDPAAGLGGGVQSQTPQDTRSQFAEQSVWWQASQTGYSQALTQAASGVSQVLGLNDVTGDTGIQGDLSQLFQDFASWAANPTSSSTQTSVIGGAQALASDIGSAATVVQQSVTSAQSDVQTSVGQINQLVGQVQQWNQQIQSGLPAGAGGDAQVYNALQQLSNLAPITTTQNNNGTLNIFLNGQTSLLQGTQQNTLTATSSSSTGVAVTDSQGTDVTQSVGSGQLGGLIDYINTFAPTLIGNGSRQGSLNQLAQGLADSVNGTLGGSTPMFQYTAGNPTGVAQSLTVNPDMTATALGAAESANPSAPANLGALQNTFTTQFNTIAQQASNTLVTQTDSLNLHTQLLNQATALRSQIEGVSLSTEATNLIQYQQGFQAAAQVVSVVNSLMQTVINMVPRS
jgi:flagellar hook-associated protein 1 FlgK